MKKEEIIPNGMRAASFTLEGNKMTIFFEPEKYVPKVGDLVKIIYPSGNKYFCEVSDVNGYQIRSKKVLITPERVYFEDDTKYFTYDSIEKLTPEEFQAEFEKHGYAYDFEMHTAKKKRKRVAVGGMYYYADSALKACKLPEQGDDFDDEYFESGNYFETKEECQTYCDYMKECSLKYFDK